MITTDEAGMELALTLAKQGEGAVEPNPMVGCVLVKHDELIGQGWHAKFGGPHAEVNAIQSVCEGAASEQDASELLRGSTAYVTLEPCCHFGKTGPCADALIEIGVARVVVACQDPNPEVAGNGIQKLRDAGIEVSVGLMESEARDVLAPYLKRTQHRLPWIIAKWAMTLDGKIATSTGDSQWISNEESRTIVHQIRGRVDAVLVGIGTALADDPMLNARPSGFRDATRVVVDSKGRIPLDSKLVATAKQFPVLIAVGAECEPAVMDQLQKAGCEVFQSRESDPNDRLIELLKQLVNQGMTNVLVEGGGQVLGSLNDLDVIDEYHIFIGPKLVGSGDAQSPISGDGKSLMADANQVNICSVSQVGQDVYIVGRANRR